MKGIANRKLPVFPGRNKFLLRKRSAAAPVTLKVLLRTRGLGMLKMETMYLRREDDVAHTLFL